MTEKIIIMSVALQGCALLPVLLDSLYELNR